MVSNPDKCTFAVPEVDYLGMRVSGSGCIPLTKHTEIISAFPCLLRLLTDKKGLQKFLGILYFYRRFINAAAGILRPLTEALKGKPSTLTWDLEMNQSFAAAKSILANVPTLVLIRPPGYLYLLMPLDLMLEQFYNKKYPGPGHLLRFIQRSCLPLNPGMPTLLSATSASC